MKIQLETITNNTNQSFSIMNNPQLSDLFFWHSHPQYELVFIEANSGTRHIGNHISTFHNYDLVLIGSDIPHLNFDYGIKSDYRQIVVHFKKEFAEDHFQNVPELLAVSKLFDQSKRGVSFRNIDFISLGERLFNLEYLSPYAQYIEVIDILNALSLSEEFELLHDTPFLNTSTQKEHRRIQNIYAFVDRNYNRKIELKEIADHCYMTKEAFCRYFKKKTKYTFIDFLNRYRISHSKRYLMAGNTISEACYQSGFESLSYFNRVFKKISGENPREFRKRYT